MNTFLSFLSVLLVLTPLLGQPTHSRMSKKDYVDELARYGLNHCQQSCAIQAFDCIIQRDPDTKVVTYQKLCVIRLDKCEKQCNDETEYEIPRPPPTSDASQSDESYEESESVDEKEQDINPQDQFVAGPEPEEAYIEPDDYICKWLCHIVAKVALVL